MISEVLHILGRLLDLEWTGGEPDRSLEQQCVNHFPKIPRARSRQPPVDRWAFLPRARVSIFADSKFQNVRGFRRARPPPSTQGCGTCLPAKPGGPADPNSRAQRGNAGGAKKPVALAAKPPSGFPPARS